MKETTITMNEMNEQVQSMLFKFFIFKSITAIILIGIIVFITYKLMKYYKNKEIEISFSYKEKEKKDPEL